ncbi:exported hypothetical protein [Verrucomicrobia bacterium]|nr:exported hypothetical protein [Verrucomicrobiota bacterium]
MKITCKTNFLASVSAGVAAVGIALCGDVVRAQSIFSPTVQVAGDLIVNLQSIDHDKCQSSLLTQTGGCGMFCSCRVNYASSTPGRFIRS